MFVKKKPVLMTIGIVVLALLLAVICFFVHKSIFDRADLLVEKYADAVNQRNVASYIKLFTNDNQMEMQNFVSNYGEEAFFQNSSIEIEKIKELSEETGRACVYISDDERSAYSEILVYYVEMNIEMGEIEIKNDVEFDCFVIVKEENTWKILRISVPNINKIVEFGEGFGDEEENIVLEEQNISFN